MISKHITLAEATKSQTAIRLGIKNVPNKDQLEAMKYVAENIFERVREHFKVPIGVSSFFRGFELNKAIGGSTTSQHCKGEAIDIDADIFGGITNKQIFDYVKDNLDFDQLIFEFGTEKNPDWVHVSLVKGLNRRQILKAYKSGGKTIYKPFKP
jgi:hypothetical protein